ncbi:glycosyltransferase [Lachnospiraceae bacterium WCA-9-b2]|jgi:glycosyltransferase involved in cell wall biosynthesis|uniref:Glycosyltransferase n=1 Tax=Sporofaciens musculi TaxID=2681861 RepID=A0A7X3SKX6_9FIRM|nr:glycosyltransferase [Sporofaciens musculi]MXP77831.1 glycosyltransferase [Sporofaciens musculi]
MSDNEIMVSVFCMTYNHENYIRDTLEGFLMQKTNFTYEILVHEDASTDGTAEILRDYEQHHPQIIKVIYEKENKYGKGIDYLYDILAPLSKGKYIAICEGDDAWVDEDKLQLQVDYMEEHPECSLIGHKAFLQYPPNWTGERDARSMGYGYEGNVPYESMFKKWEIPTSSFLFRKDLYMEMPPFFRNAPTGDEPLEFYLAGRGNVYFLNRVMSVYNKMTAESWSVRFLKNDFLKMAMYYSGYIDLFREIDRYTSYTKHVFFSDCIRERIRRASIYILSNSKSYYEAGKLLQQLADTCCDEWKDYILSQQRERFYFWDPEGAYWECAKGKLVYIYGAGRLAAKFLIEIAPDKMKINGVIVSDGQRRENSLRGLNVMCLSDFINNHEADSFIVIAVKDEFVSEIKEKLASVNFQNYVWVYESVYEPIFKS